MTKFKEVQHYQALIDDLIARGKEKGFLTHEEVLHALPGDHGPEQYEEILSTLEERKILVVDNEKDAMKKLSRPSMDEDSEKDSLDISDDDDAADYSSRSTDPVRMYLREMGAVPLLDRDGEVVIAKKIEQGEMDVLYALVEVPVAVEELINVGEDLRQNRIKLKDVVKTIEEDDPSEVVSRYARSGVPVALIVEGALDVPGIDLPEQALSLVGVIASSSADDLPDKLAAWLAGSVDKGIALAANFPFCRAAVVDELAQNVTVLRVRAHGRVDGVLHAAAKAAALCDLDVHASPPLPSVPPFASPAGRSASFFAAFLAAFLAALACFRACCAAM